MTFSEAFIQGVRAGTALATYAAIVLAFFIIIGLVTGWFKRYD